MNVVATVLIGAVGFVWGAVAALVAVALGRVIDRRDAAEPYLNILDLDTPLYVETILAAAEVGRG